MSLETDFTLTLDGIGKLTSLDLRNLLPTLKPLPGSIQRTHSS